MRVIGLFAALVLAWSVATTAQAQTVLNVVTAGDVNMLEYINDYLAPKFEAQNPGVRVRAVGTGPGDAGSQAIYEKIAAQRQSPKWDVDVAIIHQRMAGEMVNEGLLAKYRDAIKTGNLVSRETAKIALGVNVDGYVMPMFHNQIVIAYNPEVVPNPPASLQALAEWVKSHPRQFGYNGITGGMSGQGFVFAWMDAFTDMGDQLRNGPWIDNPEAQWTKALAELREFNKYVVLTPGQAGTLDALNRGEISMGLTWVDMFYAWRADGRVNPKLKLYLPSPGLPGNPMYYVEPARAAHPELARKFIEFATSPQIQADGIVRKFRWFPGIDAKYVQPLLNKEEWDSLYADVPPEEISSKGKSMPQAKYFKAILEAYERNVAK